LTHTLSRSAPQSVVGLETLDVGLVKVLQTAIATAHLVQHLRDAFIAKSFHRRQREQVDHARFGAMAACLVARLG